MEKEKLQHYSIRKLSVGAASVLIGLSFMGLGHATQVKADTVSGSQQQVVETSKPKNEFTERAASLDDNQVNNQSLNDDQGQAQAANVTESQKSVRGGSEQLNASSETQNETPDNNNSKAATTLRTSENEEKVVENNKNKVETTTLNLNQDTRQSDNSNTLNIKQQVSKINSAMLRESKEEQNSTNNPAFGSRSLDERASGTRHTSVGDTRLSADETKHVAVSSDIKLTPINDTNSPYKDGQVSEININQQISFGITGTATLNKDDVKKGNRILLGTIQISNDRFGQDAAIDNNDFKNETNVFNQANIHAMPVTFMNQLLGNIELATHDSSEMDLFFNVNKDLIVADNPTISFNNILAFDSNGNNLYHTFRGMKPADTYIQQFDTGKHKYTVKYDYTTLSTSDSKYVWDHSFQQFGDIGSWRQVWPIDSFRSHLFVPDSDGKFDLSNLQLKDNGEYDLAFKVKSANGANLPIANGFLFTRNYLPCEVAANGKLVLTNNDQNILWWNQDIGYSTVDDNLSAKDVLDKTPKGGARVSKQSDGSLIVGLKLTKDDLADFSATSRQNDIKTWMKQTGLVNIVDSQNNDKIISNTLRYYQDNPYNPNFDIGFTFQSDTSKPAVWTVSDVTPQNYSAYVGNTIPTHTSSDGANTGSFNAELYRNAVVNYVDDDNSGVNVSKDSIVGLKNIGTNYTINIPQGYVLATDNTDGTNYKWGADKSKITYTFQDDQKVNDENPIVIHLTHGRKDLVDSNVISETVHYQFEDGTKAADDYNAKHVVSSRIGHKDLVTGQTIWDSDWSKETFPEVTAPHINGYTANQPKIDAQNVDGTSQDIVKTVVYKANDQKIFVHYIDDDVNGQDLHTDPLVGKSNTVANYTTGDAIKGYENQGYDLVSDDTHGQAIRYDADDDHDQNYSVHLKHHISTVTDPKLLTATFDRTVTEKFPDGQTKTLTQHYVINRTGTQDQVTKKYTFANWSSAQVHEDKGDKLNGYTAVIASQNPSEIVSIQDGTPVVKAEVFTNSNDAIQPVNANETVVITYNANDQKIYVHYIDDEAGKDLHTDSLVGKTNTDANYTTGDAIKGYLDQGYDLVSDDTKGAELKYDADDAHDRIYNVHFKHHISAVTDPKLLMATFNRTVNEKLPDGQTKTLTQHYVINRTGTQDQVTKKYTFGNWSTAQVHEDKGDNLDGYTAVITNQNPGNIASIQDGTPVVKAEVFTNANDNSIQPVNANELVEIAYNANDQKATVTFIDDDAQKDKQVLQTKNLVGKSNTKADYDTGADIENYLNKGFELVSDDTQGKPITFDAHDKVDQSFEVHFKHHISDVTDPRILNVTFDRVITEHTPDGKDKQFKQHYVITRTGTQDQVTKQYKFSDWTVANVHEDKLDNFKGYTAHINSAKPDDFITVIDGVPTVAKAEQFTNENGKLLPKNVSELADISYTANPQSAAIVYIDDTADKVLSKVMTTGHYGEAIEFTPNVSSIIDDLVKKGYVLVSNDFDSQKYDADNNQNIFDVHLKHGTLDVTRSKDVTETIHYVYDNNSKAHDDYVATKKFENHGVKDLVTGNTTWDAKWTPENDQFAQVNSPEIPGYTADKTSIPAQTVNADSKSLEYTVTYTQTPYESSDPVQPAQPSTPVVPDQPNVPDTDQQSVDNNAPKKAKHHNKSKDLNTDSNDDYGNTVNKSNDYTGIKTVKITQNGKPARVIKINQVKSETVDPVKSTVHVKSQLPKTGSDKDQTLVALGLASASLSGLFGLGLRKKKEEN